MVWNHPKETSICISYGRMFQLCTSVTNARGSRSTKTWWRTAIRRRWQTIAVWEASRRFLHRLGIWISTEIQKFTDSLDHIWATPPPNPFRAFLLGGGEIRMERGNTERCQRMCYCIAYVPFFNSGFPWLFVFNIHDKKFSKEVQHLKANDQRRCLVPFGV